MKELNCQEITTISGRGAYESGTIEAFDFTEYFNDFYMFNRPPVVYSGGGGGGYGGYNDDDGS